MYVVLTIFIGYLFGCLHGSQIVGKYKEVNFKHSGSKNAGASNAVMLLGWKYGFIVACIDIFKAIISFLLVAIMLQKLNVMIEMQVLLMYLNGLFVLIGHNFPLTMHFKGGKGTASFLGFLVCLDWKFAFIAFCIFLIVAFLTKYFVIGTLMGYMSFVVYTARLFEFNILLVAVVFMLLFFIKHTENFKRIINKEEMQISTLFHKEVS